MNLPEPDEQDRLDVVRLIAGHDSALNDLMGRHAEKLFHYLIRMLEDEAEAADLAQESFVRVYQHRAKFNTRQRFSTWVYAIATNLARDRLRWRMRHPHVSLEAEPQPDQPALGDRLAEHRPGPSELLQRAERAEAVRQAVARLPEELRTPLILAEYEEKSHLEIAGILNCTAKAVEMRVRRARLQLRAELQDLRPQF